MWTDVYSLSYSPPSLCINYSSISCSLSISRWVCLRLFSCIIRSVVPVLRTLVLNCTVQLALNCTSFYWSWHWTARHFTEVGTELHCTLVLRPSFIRWHCGVHFSRYSVCSRDYKLSSTSNLYPYTRPILCSCFSYPSLLHSGITAHNWMFQQHPFLADVIIKTVSQILKFRLPEPCFCAKNSFATLY